MRRIYAARFEERFERGGFVVNPLLVGNVHFFASRRDNGISFFGNHNGFNPCLAKQPNSVTIAAIRGDGFSSGFIYPDAIVGENAVEVEDEEPDDDESS